MSKLNYFDDSQITLAIERLNFKKKEEFVDLYETKLLMPIHERYRDRHIHVIRRFVLAIARHRPLLVSEKTQRRDRWCNQNEYPFGYPKFFATLNIILFSATLGLSKLIPILIRDIFSLKKTGRLHPPCISDREQEKRNQIEKLRTLQSDIQSFTDSITRTEKILL